MKGLKTIADNLSDRVNQSHYILDQLTKVYETGLKNGRAESRWIDSTDRTPEIIEGRQYSENVLVKCNGRVMVMCFFFNNDPQHPQRSFTYWSNCHNVIDGDCSFDKNNDFPTHWQPIPTFNS